MKGMDGWNLERVTRSRVRLLTDRGSAIGHGCDDQIDNHEQFCYTGIEDAWAF